MVLLQIISSFMSLGVHVGLIFIPIILISSPFAPSNACLLVAQHKGYISHDVVFDESVFLFAKLHPNAGALLQSQILLPSSLCISEFGSNSEDFDRMPKSTDATIEPAGVPALSFATDSYFLP